MRFRIVLSLALASLNLHAAVFCAKTGNEFGTALNTADSNGQDDEIRIVVGTHISDIQAPQDFQWQYRLSSEDDLDKDVIISGGWNAANNCATQTTQNPAETILDARYWGPVFQASLTGSVPDWAYSGTFAISNLTFNRGKSFQQAVTTGLEIFNRLASTGSVIVDNIYVVNGQSAANFPSAVFLNLGGSGSLRLRNSIVSFNTFTGQDSIPVLVRPLDDVIAYVSNNSIFANSATSIAAGLRVLNIATVSNNVVADNTSTANPSYQFHTADPTSLTLIKNHFGSRQFENGAPFSEVDTTTGNAFWAPLGVERIPLEISPLRDSGDNTPVGGALAIDFRGNPRVVNTTIDRGASEAPAPSNPADGPIVTDNTPVKGSTTWLYGAAGQSAFGQIAFTVSGGDPGALTLIDCIVTSGTVLIGAFPKQWVATGQAAEPVLVGFDNLSEAVQTGVVFCSFKRNGVEGGGSFAAYTFKGALETGFEDGFEVADPD
jgi:hypothetical protein